MAFDLFELGRFTGRPVHLFVFRRQGLTWRYWQGDEDREFGGHVYQAAQIQRSEIKQTAERAKDNIKITFAYLRAPDAPEYPSTQSLGDNWFPYVPTDTVSVICMATHIGDTDPPTIEWMGQVTQPKFSDTELELTCEPSSGSDRARNQGAKWQRSCWKTVYSTGPRGCNLGVESGEVEGTVTKLEQISGDTPPQAHVLVPGLMSYLTVLAGKSASWVDGIGTPHSSLVVSAYFAYEWTRTVTLFNEVVTSTGFSWADGSDKVDESSALSSVTYNKLAALVLADATGLTVGSTISVPFPGMGTSATISAAAGLALTAPEFVDSPFPLAGGRLEWTNSNGLVLRRHIRLHEVGSDTLTLAPGGETPDVGDDVLALPNCPRTYAACQARGNTPNFGGAFFKPVKNPKEDSMSWG